MNEGVLKEIFDKFENMEQIPQSIMNELARAIERKDIAVQEYILMQRKIQGVYKSFEHLMSLHQELREKSGLDNNADALTYDIFERYGILDSEG
jgi:hypothetical protein